MSNQEKLEEAVKDKLEVFNPPMRVKKANYKNHFPDGGLLVLEDAGKEYAVLARYPFAPGQKKVNMIVRDIIFRLYPGKIASIVEPRREANFFKSLIFCESQYYFYCNDYMQTLIKEEAQYARDENEVTIYYSTVNDNKDDAIVVVFAVSSYPYSEMGKEIEKHFTFPITCVDNQIYQETRKAYERVKKQNEKSAEDGTEVIKKFLDEPNAYKKLYEYLEYRVLGQTDLYKVSYNIFSWAEAVVRGKKYKKNSTFVIAPSGSGKTELMRAVRDFFRPYGIKVMIADCSNLSSAGYKGTNPMELFEPFFENGKTLCGILCLDELDKKCIPSIGASGVDYNKETLDQLLAALEGNPIMVNKKSALEVDSSKIFILAGGAFNHLRKERESVKALGFGSSVLEKPAQFQGFTKQELLDNTFAEFLGRFSSVVQLKQLKYTDFLILLRRHRKELEEGNAVHIYLSRQYKQKAYEEFCSSELGARGVFADLWDAIITILHECRMTGRNGVSIYVRDIKDIVVRQGI